MDYAQMKAALLQMLGDSTGTDVTVHLKVGRTEAELTSVSIRMTADGTSLVLGGTADRKPHTRERPAREVTR